MPETLNEAGHSDWTVLLTALGRGHPPAGSLEELINVFLRGHPGRCMFSKPQVI